jgi:citrate lyase subunit beta / citryl-CoA lyase
MDHSFQTCVAPLFVPATRPDRFAKAAQSGADAVIIDLEDAVSAVEKVKARAALTRDILPDCPVLFRINAVATQWFKDDAAALAKLGINCVMLAKTEGINDIAQVRAIAPHIQIIALIESAKGLANARAIAAAGAVRLAFGSLDYCVDLGCAHEREALLSARSELVLASRLAAIAPPIDGVTAQVEDEAALKNDAAHAAALGFSGKLCIHPTQVAPVKLAFAPSTQEIAWAERILASSQDGVALVDGMMVDAPVRLRAQAILARAVKP